MGEHKKVFVEHYPVAQLPDDLRARFDGEIFVNLVIASEASPEHIAHAHDRPLSWYLGKLPPLHTDPAGDIRKLRDEWE